MRTLPSNRSHRRTPSQWHQAITWRQHRQLRLRPAPVVTQAPVGTYFPRQYLRRLLRELPVTNRARLNSPPIPGTDSGQSVGIGIQQGGESTGQPGAIPVPGSTITGPGSGSDSAFPGKLGLTGSGPGSDLGTIGSADLANKPDLIAQLFPNFLDQLLRGRGESAGMESRAVT